MTKKQNGTVQILACPKGGVSRFFEVPAADAVSAGLAANRHGVIGASYDEISASVDYTRTHGTAFPDTCPRCAAAKVSDSGNDFQPTRSGAPRKRKGYTLPVPSYARKAVYACGGTYELKAQCQNHTDKWWGRCPVTKARIVAVLAANGIEAE